MRQYFIIISFIFTVTCPLLSQPQKITKEIKKKAYELFEALNSADNPYFKEGGLSNDQLVWFGCLYSNNHSRIVDSEYKLPSAYIDSIVWRFFAKKVKHHTLNSADAYVPYKNGKYSMTGSDAGEMGKMKVTNYTKIGDNKFEIIARFYDDEDYTADKLTVSQMTERGKTRFIILSFEKMPKNLKTSSNSNNEINYKCL